MLVQLDPSNILPSINVSAIDRTKGFTHFDRKQLKAYWLQGLSHRALLSPNYYASTSALLTRQAYYIKSSLPLGVMSYIDNFPPSSSGLSGEDYYRTVAFTDDLAWEMNSYLFELTRCINDEENQHTFLPRYVVNQANNIPYHGEHLKDDCRVMVTPQAVGTIEGIHREYVKNLDEILKQLHPAHIDISNNGQTSLSEEICTHEEFVSETNDIFLKALIDNNPELVKSSQLVGGVDVIECPRLYHPVLLSFYLAALRSHGLNTEGTRLGEFKNYYNVLEFYMISDGQGELQRVIEKKVGKGNLSKIVSRIKKSFDQQTVIAQPFYKEEDFYGQRLVKIIPSSRSLSVDIAERLYTKRNAVMHSKKMRNGSLSTSINPSIKETTIEFEVALLRAIAEHVITKAKVTD